MIGKRTPLSRCCAVAATAVTTLALVSGCAGPPKAVPSNPSPGPDATKTPGRIAVKEPGVNLLVTGVTAHIDSSGDGTLSMRVDNADGAPEHIDMIATPDGGRAVLRGGRSLDGSMTSAGILVQPGGVVRFGGHGGPAAVLHHVQGVTSQHTLPLMIQFGVAGLVRVDARVTGGV